MIDLNKDVFIEHHTTLKETSLDQKGDKMYYMTSSTLDAINFDDVKTEYIKSLKMSETPSSNDALFEDGKGAIVFVEFKNKRIKKDVQSSICKKIYDSVLMFTDLTSTTISTLRGSAKYILVYSESKNKDNGIDNDLSEKNEYIQSSSSYNCIAKTINGYAKKEYICFGLRRFLNYCFKEVHTFTEKEFEAYLNNL